MMSTDGMTTVSYTHLDVYKRQVSVCAAIFLMSEQAALAEVSAAWETETKNLNPVETPGGIADFKRGDASITIRGNSGQPLQGKKFHVYQIFHAENAAGGESIQYTLNPNYEKPVKKVVGEAIGKDAEQVTEYEVIDHIQSCLLYTYRCV